MQKVCQNPSRKDKQEYENTSIIGLTVIYLDGWSSMRAAQAASPRLTSTEAVPFHYSACDVKLFEGCHTQWGPQVTGGPDESIRSCNGDSRFTGRQHHNDCLDVWDGETRVLSKTPDMHAGGEETSQRLEDETAPVFFPV